MRSHSPCLAHTECYMHVLVAIGKVFGFYLSDFQDSRGRQFVEWFMDRFVADWRKTGRVNAPTDQRSATCMVQSINNAQRS